MRVLVIRKTSNFAQYSKAATFQSFSDLAAGWGLPPKRARTLRVSSIGDRSLQASLRRPLPLIVSEPAVTARARGGNVTGGAILFAELSAKRLQLLKEVVPGLSRTAVVWNAANPANALAWRETQDAARTLGVALQSHEVKVPKDFEGAFAMMAKERPDALLVLEDSLMLHYRKEIADFAAQQRLPSMFGWREGADDGGLMSYGGVSIPEVTRRTANYVDKILKGAKPGDLPVEQDTKFELVINLKTTGALGLTIPPTLLATADEVIE